MKRIPLVSGLALVLVLFSVTKLARVVHATGPCFKTCESAQQYMDQLGQNCLGHCGAQFQSHCSTDPETGYGGYGYQCMWGGWYCSPQGPPPPQPPYPPPNPWPGCGGGFGDGGNIVPDDPSCQ